MKLKSLLIGSAALMAAATGAKAADAIVVPEPEPMEYVRVCDVYGAGFFYIPGTETCLKIGGYVRYQIDWSETDNDSVGFTSGWDFEENAGGWRKMARANVTIDARSETEYGTLGSFIELRANSYSGLAAAGTGGLISLPPEAAVLGGPLGGIENGVTRGVFVNQAYITLGGFFIGQKVTLWDQGLSGEFDKGGYDDPVHTVGYSFVPGNGLAVTLALEEYDYNYDYTPNVVGKIGLTQGWGSVAGFVAYDATAEEWALKGFASIKATQQLTVELLATYSSDPNVYTNFNYDYSFGGYLKYAATPKLSVGLGGQYFGDRQSSSALLSGNDDWAIGGVVDYKVVENFNTKLALNYNDGDSYSDGVFSGFIRFERGF